MLNQSFISVLVVDDHAATRAGVASLIETEQPRMQCIGSVGTPDEALVCTRTLQPDVIVLDVNLAGEDGLALIPALHMAARCAVVVLTSLADPSVAAHALRLGAHACLHKTAPGAELIAAIFAARRADVSHLNGAGAFSHANGTNFPLAAGLSNDAPGQHTS
jgi:two-component system, NarL family, nitrate/nitrite response regulator NarL